MASERASVHGAWPADRPSSLHRVASASSPAPRGTGLVPGFVLVFHAVFREAVFVKCATPHPTSPRSIFGNASPVASTLASASPATSSVCSIGCGLIAQHCVSDGEYHTKHWHHRMAPSSERNDWKCDGCGTLVCLWRLSLFRFFFVIPAQTQRDAAWSTRVRER